MIGARFSLKWRAHASTKKGNGQNGRSILLTIPTKRCLASYSSSAESFKNSRHVRVSGFRSPWNFCLWNPEYDKFFFMKSGILVFGIWNTDQGIPFPIKDWNPESKFHWQRVESSTWNPESKTVLDYPKLGDSTLLTLFARPASNAVLHINLTRCLCAYVSFRTRFSKISGCSNA